MVEDWFVRQSPVSSTSTMRTSCQNVKFSVETAGQFDLDTDVKLWLSSHHQPTTLELGRGGN